MKKTLILLIIIMIISMIIGTGYATEKIDAPLDFVDINEDDFAKRNQELIRKGQAKLNGIIPYSALALNVPHLYQDGQDWSGDIMQTRGVSIESSGCTLTSFTMIQQFFGGSDDPGQVNAKLGDILGLIL